MEKRTLIRYLLIFLNLLTYSLIVVLLFTHLQSDIKYQFNNLQHDVIYYTKSLIYGTNYACEGCNIILIVVDTLRADHLPCYGYVEDTAPAICSIASEGVLFENAFSQASHSTLSFESMLTSKYGYAASVGFITLPEILGLYNYSTAAFVANGHLGAEKYVKLFNNYTEFIDIKKWEAEGKANDINNYAYNSSVVTLEVLEWLREHKSEKTFVYINYMDVHTPRIVSDSESPASYQDAIKAADSSISRLVKGLESEGFLNNVILIITSDHGEELGDHGRYGHAHSLYEEQLHVPLILKYPNSKPVRVKSNVRLLDLMPTLLEMVNITQPVDIEGISLLPLVSGAEDNLNLPIYSMADHEKLRVSLRNNNTKYIITFSQNLTEYLHAINGINLSLSLESEEIYNLELDPKEKNNLTGTQETKAYREEALVWLQKNVKMLQIKYLGGSWQVNTKPYPDTYFEVNENQP